MDLTCSCQGDRHLRDRAVRTRASRGFTLLEVLIVLVVIGILAAIATPSWLRFWANRQVTLARDELRQAILQAQSTAQIQHSEWRFSLQEQGDNLAWAIHPNDQSWKTVSTWHTINPNVTLDGADTTLAAVKLDDSHKVY